MRLADFILANIEPILAEWETFARSIWPGGPTDRTTLRDDADKILRTTAADMKSHQTDVEQADKSKGIGDTSSQGRDVDHASVLHSRSRVKSGFDLNAMISEYRALRASVLRLWHKSLSDPHQLDLDDLTRFNESIDQSLTEAIRDFAAHTELITGQLAAIVKSSDDAIIGKGLDGIIMTWNPGAERIFGYTADEAIGQHITLLVPPEKWTEEEDVLRRLSRGELVDHFQTVRVAKGGRLLQISLTVSPVRDETGRIVGASKVARDITAQKQSEQLLRESEDRFHGLADQISQLAWIADPTGSICWYNQRWYDYTGTTLDEMKGWGWKTVHHPDHLDAATEKWKRYLEAGLEWEDTFQLRRKDGEYRWFLSRARPIRDADGKLLQWFGTNTDITEVREAESALRHAREEAESANRAKDIFLATLSHELRSPLNSIVLWANLLRGRENDPELLREGIDAIETGTKTQIRLMEDVLDVARIVSGKMSLEPESCQLAKIIHASLADVRSSAEARNIKLDAQLDPTVSPISCDPVRMQQVIWNLLSNAIKFTPEDGTVRISLKRDEHQLTIAVSDTGKGISAELLPHVFERYRQAETSMLRKFGGLGLGLSIVKYVIEAHGGTIQAESPGENLGATFTLCLPIKAAYSEGADSKISRHT